MKYPEYIVLDRVMPVELFKQRFDQIFRMPKGFDPKDKDRVKIFGERLKTVLDGVEERNSQIEKIEYKTKDGKSRDIVTKGPKYCDVNTAKKLAERLNVTEANISLYLNGKNKSVPMHYFLTLYDIFGATPHYLTGYTNNMEATLRLDDNGEIVYKDGVPVELIDPMSDIFSTQQYVHAQFTKLLFESFENFSTLTDLLYADEDVKNGGFALLRTYLDSQRVINMNINKQKKSKMDSVEKT